jgi:DNA repair protein RadC
MIDLTNISTIYQHRLKTVTIRLAENVVAEGTHSPRVTNSNILWVVTKAIFDALDADQEHAVLLSMTANNQARGFKIISSGGMSEASVDPKIVFRSALLLRARSIPLAHNHPSGSLTPSREDWAITQKIVEAGRMLDCPLVYHLILASNGYVSMREERPGLFA